MRVNKGKADFKGVVVAILLIAIAGAAFFFLKGCNGMGFGLGNGNGIGNEASGDNNNDSDVTGNVDDKEVTTADDTSDEQTTEENVIEIKVKGDEVTLNGSVIKDADELKEKLEASSNDDMEYILIEDDAILGTYNWVVEVLDELKIEYSTETVTEE